MTDLLTNLTPKSIRTGHAEQHNEVNRRVIALQDLVEELTGTTGTLVDDVGALTTAGAAMAAILDEGSLYAVSNGVPTDALVRSSGGAVSAGSTAFVGSGLTSAMEGYTIAIAGAGTAQVTMTSADVTFPALNTTTFTLSVAAVTDSRLNTAGGAVVVGGHPIIYQGISGNTLTGCTGGVPNVTVSSGASITCPGPAGHVTTIAHVIDSTHATLTAPAPVAVTSAPYWVYNDGTDELQALANRVRTTSPGQEIVITGTVVIGFRNHPQNANYKTGLVLGDGTHLRVAPGATLMLAPYLPSTNSANCDIVKNYNIGGAGVLDRNILVDGGGTIEGNGLYQQANFYTGIDELRAVDPHHRDITVKNIRGLTQSSSNLPGGETVFFSADLGVGAVWDSCVAQVDQGWTVPGVVIGGNAGKIDNGSNVFSTTAAAFPEGFSAAKHVGWYIQLNFPGAGIFLRATIVSVQSSTSVTLSVANPTSNKLAANWSMGAMCASGFSANGETGPKWNNCLAWGITLNNGFTINNCRGSLHQGCTQRQCWNMGFNFEVSPDAIVIGCHSGGKAPQTATGFPDQANMILGTCIGDGFIFNGSINGQLIGCSARNNGSTGVEAAANGSATVVQGVFCDNQQWGISQASGGVISIVGLPTVTGNSVGQVNQTAGCEIVPTPPRTIEIPVWTPSAANSGWSTVTAANTDFGGARVATNDATQGHSIEWDVVLPPGTYAMAVAHRTGANVGIYTITLDGASLTSLGGSADTIDGYLASGTSPLNVITGIVIPWAGGTKRLKFLVNTRNAANTTGYNGTLEGAIVFVRTA